MDYVHVSLVALWWQDSSCVDSNGYVTGTNNPELYIMLRLFIVMFDEYSEQNNLSIVQTKKR